MGSPLNAVILIAAAADYEAGGITAEVLGGEELSPPGSVPSLRLTGALHRMVLERLAPELALYYPSVGGTAPIEGVWPAVRALMLEQTEAVRERVKYGVQTNEVARAVALLPGLLHIAKVTGNPKVRLLEVGASAGLTLRFQHFHYMSGEQTWGDPESPVQLTEPWRGTAPDLSQALEVVEVRGCDPFPIDPLSTDGRLTLTSYVWPDQTARLERLRGAFEIAARVPAAVDEASAADWVRDRLAEPTDAVTVVWHSVVMQYVPPAERDRLDEVLQNAELASPLWRLSYEPMRKPESHETPFRLLAREHRTDGSQVDTVIGHGGGHGPPFVLA